MDILADLGRQKRRYENLKALATALCAQMQKRVAADGSTVRFSFDENGYEEFFSLYLHRLRAFKRAAGMTQSLAGPVKVAALTSLCLMDRPCISASHMEERSVVVFRHAWLALNAAASLLDIQIKAIPTDVRAELLQVLTVLPWMEEDRRDAQPGDDDFHLSFERRLTILTALYNALRRQTPINALP